MDTLIAEADPIDLMNLGPFVAGDELKLCEQLGASKNLAFGCDF